MMKVLGVLLVVLLVGSIAVSFISIPITLSSNREVQRRILEAMKERYPEVKITPGGVSVESTSVAICVWEVRDKTLQNQIQDWILEWKRVNKPTLKVLLSFRFEREKELEVQVDT